MKVKVGKVVLGKNDIRLGNFIIHKEKAHYKICDVAGMWSFRVNMFSGMYMLIEECIKRDSIPYLESIVKIYYAVTTVPPDAKMMEDLYNAYMGILERMKEAMPQTTDQDEEAVIEDMKKSLEASETLQKVIEDGAEPDKAE